LAVVGQIERVVDAVAKAEARPRAASPRRPASSLSSPSDGLCCARRRANDAQHSCASRAAASPLAVSLADAICAQRALVAALAVVMTAFTGLFISVGDARDEAPHRGELLRADDVVLRAPTQLLERVVQLLVALFEHLGVAVQPRARGRRLATPWSAACPEQRGAASPRSRTSAARSVVGSRARAAWPLGSPPRRHLFACAVERRGCASPISAR